MVGRVNEVTEETENAWDIFLVEKEKQEEFMSHKPIKVYQKEKDKGKGKFGGPPSIKVKDNLPPPPLITTPVKTTATKDQPTAESMDVEDGNPNPEVLYIVVDKDIVGRTDMASEPSVAEQNDNTQEKPTDDKEKKLETQTQTQTQTKGS